MKLKNKNVLVLGLGSSGDSAIKLLLKKKAKVFYYDDNLETLNDYNFKSKNLTKVELINEEFLKQINLVILSPGISIYNENVKLCKLLNIKVISELELGLMFSKGKVIAITGSNGKTTTVNLIEQAFNYANKKSLLVGNVGNPITKFISKYKTNYIAEVSSFQLESSNIKPNVACILNISENHLDRHFSFNEYKETKFKIFENMKDSDILVLNADDENLFALKNREVKVLNHTVKIKPKILWFSLNKEVNGAYLLEDKIYFKQGNKITYVCDKNEIKLFGEHNLQNILAMICVCMSFKLSIKSINLAIKNFQGVEHRLQFIETKNGVDFINDSKSTTPVSTITAVNSLTKPIILILGGSDKKLDYTEMFENIKNKVKFFVLTGDIAKKLEKTCKNLKIKNFKTIIDFTDAVKFSSEKASDGDIVLLSPATASFDYFKNFEQRGDAFISIVKKL